jgi:hypothetical protein
LFLKKCAEFKKFSALFDFLQKPPQNIALCQQLDIGPKIAQDNNQSPVLQPLQPFHNTSKML